MENHKNDSCCWIFDNKIRDILQLFIIKLELSDIKNIRLVCRKFQLIIDDYGKLFNLIFRLTINEKMKKQELKKIIIKHPIITSFFLVSDGNSKLIGCIPDYTKELKLCHHRDKQLEIEFPSSLESLTIDDCTLSLKCWNSIPSSLSFLRFENSNIVDENRANFLIKIFPLNLKKLNLDAVDAVEIDLIELKIWPQNLDYLQLGDITISSDNLLKLSTLPNLSILNLGVKGITEIDLSNFNSLKFLIYCASKDEQQYIYFPSSSIIHTLILFYYDKNVQSTKLPNSLIRLDIHGRCPSFNSFLLKEENKLPLLQQFNIYCYGSEFEIEVIPKILHQYDALTSIILDDIQMINKKEDFDKMFSYIPPNLEQLEIYKCKSEHTSYIIKLFSNNNNYDLRPLFHNNENSDCLWLIFYKK